LPRKPSIFDNWNWYWEVCGIRGSLYNVLGALVNQAGGTGLIEFVSMRYLAECANITEETARQHVRELERMGFIVRVARDRKDGRRGANGYRINRTRLYPKEPRGRYSGAETGLRTWKVLLDQLTNDIGKAETYLLASQIRDVFFDWSNRTNGAKTQAIVGQRRKGVLYLISETDAVEDPFYKHVKKLYRMAPVDGCEITYFRLLIRRHFRDEN
jgi:DNA-binding Lrp family transcriptional regulator